MKKICSYTLLFVSYSFSSILSQSLFESLNKSFINPSQVIASIDTIKITAEEFFYNYEFGPAFTKRNNNSKKVHLDFMINEKLLALQGFNNNVVNEKETKNLLNDIQSDIATEELYKDSILSKVNFSDQEINKMMYEKNSELEIKWLFEKNEKNMQYLHNQLLKGISFDSLFNRQLDDSIYLDDRRQITNIYNLRKKNPILAKICDTLKVGQTTKPISINNEWYIILKSNVVKNLITTESEVNKIKRESVEALTKTKMDSLSDEYIHNILKRNNPIIKRDAFNITRSFIGKYRLNNEKYNEWSLELKLEKALENLGLKKTSDQTEIILVELKDDQIYLSQFMAWFQNRNLYIKLLNNNILEFSKSLENLVWLMIRDKLLTEIAKKNNYYNRNWVKKQSEWWTEKVAYSAQRREMVNSIVLNNDEVVKKNKDNSIEEELSQEFTKRLFREISRLRKIYNVNIDYDILNKINVSTENDKKAINLYTAKKGGLIPRPAYPTIDNEWENWL